MIEHERRQQAALKVQAMRRGKDGRKQAAGERPKPDLRLLDSSHSAQSSLRLAQCSATEGDSECYRTAPHQLSTNLRRPIPPRSYITQWRISPMQTYARSAHEPKQLRSSVHWLTPAAYVCDRQAGRGGKEACRRE